MVGFGAFARLEAQVVVEASCGCSSGAYEVTAGWEGPETESPSRCNAPWNSRAEANWKGLCWRQGYILATATFAELKKHKTLWKAWRQVRSNAFDSPSPTTRAEAKEFDLHANSQILSISARLSKSTFHFDPSVGVPVPRPGKKSIRPIVKSSITNRLVCRALLDLLEHDETFTRYQKSEYNFGALPKRRVSQAWQAVLGHISKGCSWYIRSDIRKFFDSIPKESVAAKFEPLFEDVRLLELFRKAINVELENTSALGDLKRYFPLEELGIAQGNSLSPLIANVMLDDFDQIVANSGGTIVRYVDDFVILADSQKAVMRAFKSGSQELRHMHLHAYGLPPVL